jgi:hypothetical protein
VSIVSSTFVAGHAQIDGRKYVRETHTDHLAVLHIIEYLSAVGADNDAILAAHAIRLAIILRDTQAQNNLDKNSIADWIFEHVTVAQMRIALRLAYRDATRFEAARLARFVNELTIAQIENVFSVNTATATLIKSRALNLATKYDELNVAAGE